VWFESPGHPAYSCSSEAGPGVDFWRDALRVLPWLIDIYVTDQGWGWTFVLTHEEDFGPYFAEPIPLEM
jgi:hypothetical protein